MIMPTVAYTSPFVPPEWIVAHGCRPMRIMPAGATASAGACPLAAGVVEALRQSGAGGDAVVLTTTCDQMRRAAEEVQGAGRPVMLMNVPATWRGEGPRRLYREELLRLGRFLKRSGGHAPAQDELRHAIAEFDAARQRLGDARKSLGARGFAEAVQSLASGDREIANGRSHAADSQSIRNSDAPFANGKSQIANPTAVRNSPTTIGDDVPQIANPKSQIANPLALVGGPMRREDFWIYDLIEQAGGTVVLDATEGGERCLPAAIEPARLDADPVDALVRAYFDHIPDAFRRPDTMLQTYLGERLAERHVRGILFVRFLWCDQWHAQLERLRQRSRLPVVEVDLGGIDADSQRTRTRVETLVNIIEAGHA